VQVRLETALGKQAKRFLDASHLVPDGIMNELVANRLEQLDAQQNGYVLDGYPHNENQVTFLNSRGLKPDKASAPSPALVHT
jgi:adenylate kinase